MANLRPWRGSAVEQSSLPFLQYKVEIGQHVVAHASDQSTVLPVGLKIIFDFGQHWEGEVAYKPKFDDSRMRLKGGELPPYSGDPNYAGAEKIHVMVQRYGLCSLLSTADTVVRALNLVHDTYYFATEAAQGKLPMFRIEEPRAYQPKKRPGMLYAPVWALIGWTDRDANVFGSRLIPAPKPMLEAATKITTAPALETDAIFDDATTLGEVMPPEHEQQPAKQTASYPKKKKGNPQGQQLDPELDDVVPF
jgi:hypothetical protein